MADRKPPFFYESPDFLEEDIDDVTPSSRTAAQQGVDLCGGSVLLAEAPAVLVVHHAYHALAIDLGASCGGR